MAWVKIDISEQLRDKLKAMKEDEAYGATSYDSLIKMFIEKEERKLNKLK